MRGTDHGIWRRIHLVPFKIKIEVPDPNLKDRLLDEAEGILAWMVRGYATYAHEGLRPPGAVVQATNEYRTDQDVIGSFLADRCTLGIAHKCYSADLRSSYTGWCKDNDEHPISSRAFASRLKDRGCLPERDSMGARRWDGLKLNAVQHANE